MDGGGIEVEGLDSHREPEEGGQRWSDRLHCVKSGKKKEEEEGIQLLSSPSCRLLHAQTLNFLPTLR